MPQPPALPRPSLDAETIPGRTIDLERGDVLRHGLDLWEAIGARDDLWDGIPSGPFETQTAFLEWLADRLGRDDQRAYAIIDKTGDTRAAVGLFFLLQLKPDMGTTEIGLVYGPALMRTVAGTEAVYRLAQYVMETNGYRRLEWRCGPDNLASVRAASRYGFTYEGTMRQTYWLKGHNWDTRIYSILDSEWPAVGARFEAWLAPENFDAEGRQIRALSEIS
ncbi:MAG: GNAT family N-acetyltransferase [Caulobacterales bacterium]|nr:GNAT family N-acetyltransferase [Caulobacterales bacterium]